mmetsp:Transcript_21905/g.62180  ORF Transcript_21905/g.62180 Transcript_21905/m.62180 type:complete len:222 (-) Transcript_21905:199-864(-)
MRPVHTVEAAAHDERVRAQRGEALRGRGAADEVGHLNVSRPCDQRLAAVAFSLFQGPLLSSQDLDKAVGGSRVLHLPVLAEVHVDQAQEPPAALLQGGLEVSHGAEPDYVLFTHDSVPVFELVTHELLLPIREEAPSDIHQAQHAFGIPVSHPKGHVRPRAEAHDVEPRIWAKDRGSYGNNIVRVGSCVREAGAALCQLPGVRPAPTAVPEVEGEDAEAAR